MEPKDIGSKMKKIRLELAINQHDVAEAIGTKQSYICGVETGRFDISAKDLKTFSNRFEVPIEYFFFDDRILEVEHKVIFSLKEQV